MEFGAGGGGVQTDETEVHDSNGSSRKEILELAIERTDELGANVAGFFNRMYANHVCPLEWNNAEAAQLGKAKGKRGCKAIPLINLLAPEGKAFFFLVWGILEETTNDCSYGFQKRQTQGASHTYTKHNGMEVTKVWRGPFRGPTRCSKRFP